MKDQPAPKPSQRRLRFTRFGIRSLLVLTLIAAYAWSRLEQRRKVMDLMFHHGIKIEYCQPEETALQYRLLRWLTGSKHAAPVKSISNCAEIHFPGVVEAVASLTEAKQLHLGFQEEGISLEPLASLVNIETITAWDNGWIIDDSFMRSMQKLEEFNFIEGTLNSDLAIFGDLKKLKKLSISLTYLNKVNNESFDALCNAENLEELELMHNYSLGTLTDISPILKLKRLKKVTGLLDPENVDHQAIIASLPVGCTTKYK